MRDLLNLDESSSQNFYWVGFFLSKNIGWVFSWRNFLVGCWVLLIPGIIGGDWLFSIGGILIRVGFFSKEFLVVTIIFLGGILRRLGFS